MKTLQIGTELVANKGQVRYAIKAAIAHLINYRGYTSTEQRRLAAKQVLWVAKKYLDWGNQPWETGRDFTPEGWYSYAEKVEAQHRANTEWPNYEGIRHIKDAIIGAIDYHVEQAA